MCRKEKFLRKPITVWIPHRGNVFSVSWKQLGKKNRHGPNETSEALEAPLFLMMRSLQYAGNGVSQKHCQEFVSLPPNRLIQQTSHVTHLKSRLNCFGSMLHALFVACKQLSLRARERDVLYQPPTYCHPCPRKPKLCMHAFSCKLFIADCCPCESSFTDCLGVHWICSICLDLCKNSLTRQQEAAATKWEKQAEFFFISCITSNSANVWILSVTTK